MANIGGEIDQFRALMLIVYSQWTNHSGQSGRKALNASSMSDIIDMWMFPGHHRLCCYSFVVYNIDEVHGPWIQTLGVQLERRRLLGMVNLTLTPNRNDDTSQDPCRH
jgi:hypothetical protein